MGCDIHLYVEHRESKSYDWHASQIFTKNPDGWVEVSPEYYDNRNYKLFAVLANVRNGYGFAGCDTGDELNVIAPPRGLPEDVSANIRKESEEMGEDGHTHSWLTVAELMAFDWTQTATCRGVLSGQQFADWDRWGRKRGEMPQGFSGDVMGALVRFIPNESMESIVRPLHKKRASESEIAKATENLYTRCEWRVPYYAAIDGSFLSRTLPMLWRLAAPENVRIVFWFDN